MSRLLHRLILLLVIPASQSFEQTTGLKHYDLDNPDKILVLPDSLHEISGVTFMDPSTVAAVQDENGILFIHDVRRNRTVAKYPFHADGDYEGITRIDDKIYVLRSDGKLYEIKNFDTRKESVKSYTTEVPADNNEGLCYDEEHDRLLIGCKNRIDKKSISKDTRQIYAWDPDKKELKKEPVYAFDEDDVKDFAKKNDLIIPGLTLLSDKYEFKFNISAIAIHPISGKLYLLDAADHLLFVLDDKSHLDHVVQLDPQLFNKPEGITFTSTGNMYITNEGQTGKARLLIFNYRR